MDDRGTFMVSLCVSSSRPVHRRLHHCATTRWRKIRHKKLPRASLGGVGEHFILRALRSLGTTGLQAGDDVGSEGLDGLVVAESGGNLHLVRFSAEIEGHFAGGDFFDGVGPTHAVCMDCVLDNARPSRSVEVATEERFVFNVISIPSSLRARSKKRPLVVWAMQHVKEFARGGSAGTVGIVVTIAIGHPAL